MIKRFLREIYLLPRGEQRALIVLSLLLVLSVLLRLGVQLLPAREPAGMEEFREESRALMAAMVQADSLAAASSRAHADSISNVTSPPSPVTGRSPVNRHPTPLAGRGPIYINQADSAQLLPLPGIGPVFAGRIIKYRDLLGGFVRMEQLSEVYGLAQETIELISSRIIIDTSRIRKIHIDTASFGELLRHPYLDLDEVKALVEYRDFKKDISTLVELRVNLILGDSTLDRVGCYFDLGK